jgi:hypothetical protein
MPFQQWVIVAIPTWVTIVVMFAVAIATSIGGVLLVRHFFKVDYFKRHHDIAGPIFSTIGVVYAVMLGFVLVVVWQGFDETRNNAILEANCYADIYRNLTGLPEPLRGQAREALDTYVNNIIEDEWPAMAVGERSLKVQVLAADYWNMMAGYEPVTESQKIFYQMILDKMNQAGELRRQRLADSVSGINPVLWFVLLAGGLITIAFTFFFGSDNIKAQMIMTTLLSLLIVLILYTTLSLDFPFSGDVHISPQSFQQVLQHIK